MTKQRIRPDGVPKVTGQLTYMTDLTFPNMLYGKVLRSAFPHANIIRLSTDRAEKLPGVKAVITHQDIPGLNGFGIIFPDQPVLCDKRVLYVGDAIAAVAAESIEVATAAIALIEVEYEQLDVLDHPQKSLDPLAPKLRKEGNILHRNGYKKGDAEAAFENCDLIVEETYSVPRQMHTYMETEGGVVVPEADGCITVYMGTQHGFKDRFQLSRILDLQEEKIRIVSSPMGGSFGGKDELNVQPYAALLALKTGRPVKLHQTRQESFVSGIKRHPMEITVKTGVNGDGFLMAHEVKIVADTGPYATLGPAVLDFSIEHAAGPYKIPHVSVDGLSVYTNNAVAGEFRGFGGNQITFALEGQMDRLADLLDMCPIDFRKLNVRGTTDEGPLGQRIVPTSGALDVLNRAEDYLLRERDEPSSPHTKRGKGIAISMHGGGLGYGRLDTAGGRLSLTNKGKIEISFGFEECGQGILAVIEEILTTEIGCSEEDIQVVIGDTDRVPLSGSTTASRGTSMVWHAVKRMKGTFKQDMISLAARRTNRPEEKLYLGKGGVYEGRERIISYIELGEAESLPTVTTTFNFPTTPDAVDSGHYLYTFSMTFSEVEVDLLTGQIKIICLDQVISAGPVVNERGYKGQIEGGGVMALGYAVMEDAHMVEGYYTKENLDKYMIPTITDVPFSMGVEPIEQLPEGDEHGPRGVGEIGTIAVAPSIVKAIHDATGVWVNQLPVSPLALLQEMERRKEPWTVQ
ncbi:xanthine dehydrogenase subunit D [Bacillus sp. Marseille-P3800]|uniref:xanthine dehydrogenase subunit D n=1 Tax=Bacillus sp. Marseille-P3800 TaxID=2014782 RepID=UPI000C06E8C2|nr:xanthine dehydrogenase subunit D [Bacillus sp. Marseille-P3800]